MAKTPSVQSEVEKTRTGMADLREREAALLAMLRACAGEGDAAGSADPDAPRRRLDALLGHYAASERAMADLVCRLAAGIDDAYARFEAAREPTGFEKFLAVFSRRAAMRRQAARAPGPAMARGLKTLLLQCDDVASLIAKEKKDAADMHGQCEAPLLDLMERRRHSAALIEEGRRRLKEINAGLATVQWKLGSVTDDKRRTAMESEREELSLALEQQEQAYRALRSAHERLDDAVLLYETLSKAATQRLSAHALVYNKLSVEMERAIQLYAAITMSLDDLLAEMSQPGAGRAHLEELLSVHAHNVVSLEAIARRKEPIDEAFARRYPLEGDHVGAIAGSGR